MPHADPTVTEVRCVCCVACIVHARVCHYCHVCWPDAASSVFFFPPPLFAIAPVTLCPTLHAATITTVARSPHLPCVPMFRVCAVASVSRRSRRDGKVATSTPRSQRTTSPRASSTPRTSSPSMRRTHSGNRSRRDERVVLSKRGLLMKKRDHLRGWRSRFFVLDGKMLFYYTAVNEHVPRGSIYLTRVRCGGGDPPPACAVARITAAVCAGMPNHGVARRPFERKKGRCTSPVHHQACHNVGSSSARTHTTATFRRATHGFDMPTTRCRASLFTWIVLWADCVQPANIPPWC